MPDADISEVLRRPRWRGIIIALGVIVLGAIVFLATLGDFPQHIPEFLGACGVLFAAYASAVVLLSRTRGRWALIYVLAIAAVCRVVNVAQPPSLSGDIYRYLWEGRVIASGQNPFVLAPSSLQLEALRDEYYEGINHKDLETIYPPLAQGAFFLGALLRPTPTGQKIVFTLFDLATLAVLVLLLIATGRNPTLCVVYAWNPLVMLEFSHSGHMDSLAIFWLMLSLLLLHRRKAVWASAAAALSFLAKFLSGVLLPVLARKKRFAGLLVFALVVIAGYLPFAGAGRGVLGSAGEYGRHWHFNSIMFVNMQRLIEDGDHIRLILAAVLVLFTGLQVWRLDDPLKYTYRVVAAALLLSPTVYPWYVCWIVPFLCFFPSRAWIGFTGLVMLSYWVWVPFRETGDWVTGSGLLALEYIPFYALLGYEGIRWLRRRGA